MVLGMVSTRCSSSPRSSSTMSRQWTLVVVIVVLAAATRAQTESERFAPQHKNESVDGIPDGLDDGLGTPRSLWPFFRDLDLLWLLEEASNSSSAAFQTQCWSDMQLYLRDLADFSAWAMQMWDSSARTPRGAMWGELWQMGNYDECMGVSERMQRMQAGGQPQETTFCIATLEVREGQTSPRASAWDLIKPPEHRLQVSRHLTRWGLCVPASCGHLQVAGLLRDPLHRLAAQHGLQANLTVSPELCRSSGQQDDSSAPWIFLACLVAWAVPFTVLDFLGKSGRLIRAISIRRNWQSLVTTKQGSQLAPADERDDIACIHAARVIGVMLVILGHRGEAYMAAPLLNANDLEKLYTNILDIIVLNGTAIVDVFFVVGGCLLSWTLIGYMQRGKQLPLITVVIYRYLRLAPAYAVTIAFLAVGLPALGSGPLWASTVGEEAQRCQQRWWTNLLFISNIVHPDKPCLDPSWYLACDTQLFLAALPLVRLMHSHPRAARHLLLAALLLAVIYPAAVTWHLGLDATLIPTPDTLGHMAETPIHMHVYVSAPCRAGPYLIGVAAGWYLRTLRTKAKYLPQVAVWALVPLALLALAVVAAGALFYPPLDASTPRWLHIAYAGLHRTLCSLFFALLLVAVASQGERSGALSFSLFRPLSRLSFCAYLTHGLVQLFSIGQQRAPAHYTTFQVVTLAVSDIVFAFVAALVLHILVEAPCNALVHSLKASRRAPPELNADLELSTSRNRHRGFSSWSRVVFKVLRAKGPHHYVDRS